MLHNPITTLRPFLATDLPFLAEIRNDPELEAASQPTAFRPALEPTFRKRYDEGVAAVCSGGQDDIEFVVCRTDDPRRAPIGVAGLYDVDLFSGNAELGVVIAAPDARRSGMGLDCYVLLAEYAFKMLRLHKIYGVVKSSNAGARGVCERLGLQAEGVQHEHRWENGEWVDLHTYGFLARNWDPALLDWRTTTGNVRLPKAA